MSTKKIGILTSGGDCPGLNATIRAVAKGCFERFGRDNVDFIGFSDGYGGLIRNEATLMKPSDFSGILTTGGTILGTSRTPYRMMQVIEENGIDKVNSMKKNYTAHKLDCLLTLGGNGTHKTANLLSSEGLNIIALPKTIDNDIFGTDVTFGFHSAVDIATDVIDRLHTTASSHGRVMVVEIMGNKAGWLTLNAAIAGGADAIVIPEIPYNIESLAQVIEKRAAINKKFSIIAVAEGAFDQAESKLKKKERIIKRTESGIISATTRIASDLQRITGMEIRTCVPGHMLRGGSPSAYDRILASKFGVHAAMLISNQDYNKTVAMIGQTVSSNSLPEIAGKSRLVPTDHQLVNTAKSLGISFGE